MTETERKKLLRTMIRNTRKLCAEFKQLIIDQESFNANRPDARPLDIEDDRILLDLAKKHLQELYRVQVEGGQIRGAYTTKMVERIREMRRSGKLA